MSTWNATIARVASDQLILFDPKRFFFKGAPTAAASLDLENSLQIMIQAQIFIHGRISK